VLSGGASPRTEVIHQVKNKHFTEKTTAIQVGDMKLILGGATKTPCFSPFDTKNDHFTKTGLGHNTGKPPKRGRFSQALSVMIASWPGPSLAAAL
jgi:hypothetical protein